jgi:class 3 adenylate cyclase/tetratricopeptide (TPR) repeat protein
VAACASCGYEAGAPFRFCPECGTEQAAAASHEQRKIVTVLFCDLAGSTALGETVDPERLRALLARYFDEMKRIVERHGGTVEKFIGDAVMAVFGVPVAHEDDALRAVRAAAEMRDALPALDLEGRIGVMTGEVVTGTSERLVTGDAVNVAARLEQAAAPGEVLLGAPTLELVRDAVDVESLEPLVLKGKTAPLAAHRLRRVRAAPERRHNTPFVGRVHELGLLRDTWQHVVAEQACELVTVVGEAGVGKSRLVAEALDPLDATVVRGRCLPYGEGITYWPVAEVLKQLGERPPDDAAAAVVSSLLGESDLATSAEEIAWAFRKTVEHAAAAEGLVVVFDDIQWGERTFHDLVEHVALLSTGAPILLLCMARPELTEQRADWPVTFRLSPLDDADVEQLIPVRVAGELRRRITHAAGGNPLFVTEMLAMTTQGDGDVVVPPTLHALLAARLDQLDAAERSVLEHAAVEGEIFHRGAVQALASQDTPVTPRLAALVRKQLIRPDRPQLAGEDGFRFCHLLIRDTAYEALPKSARAELHQRLASWLEKDGTALVELDELLGYHLELAHRYRSELGLPDDPDLAAAARQRLTASGQRAARRQDYGAALSLFERAAALVPPSEVDLVLESELGEALDWTGRGDEALGRADALTQRAVAAGDRVGELCGKIQAAVWRLNLKREDGPDDLAAVVDSALPLLEEDGDDLGLYVGYGALGEVRVAQGRFDAALEAYERAIAHAARAGHHPSSTVAVHTWCRFAGTTLVEELLRWLDENEPRAGRDQFFRAYRAWSLAKLGRFDEARAILVVARAEQADRGGGLLLANLTAFESPSVELLAGDPAAAVEFAAEGCRLHEELAEPFFLAGSAALLAQALYALGRIEEAEAWIGRAAELSAGRDSGPQLRWRQVKAKVLARRGRHAEAQQLAREVVADCDDTDEVDAQGDAYADLAEVLVVGGRSDEAITALEQALERYERKGNLVMAQRSRERLDSLRGRG